MVNATYTLLLSSQHKQTVVGSYVEATLRFDYYWASLGSNTRVHDSRMNGAQGKVWSSQGEDKGAYAYVKLFNLVTDVYDARFGANRKDYGFHFCHVGVFQTKIGKQCYDWHAVASLVFVHKV
jgi:hypothetical protein